MTNARDAGEEGPLSAEPIASSATVLPWSEAQAVLAETQFYWLATARTDGAPHVRPVLAVWLEGALFSTTNPTARKARNLEADSRCSVTARSDELDVVFEGTAAKVSDEAKLQRVAEAYLSKYGWPPTVRDGAFDAPYGAPTAGPPPYEVYELAPKVVFGFGTSETRGPRSTRWRFSPA